MQFVKPTPFQEAIDKLDQKTVIASGLNSEQWATVPLGLRDRAFFSSTIESTRFLQRGRDALADFLHGNRETLENGKTVLKTGSRADFIKQLQDFAHSEGLGPVDPEDSGTLKDISSEKRLGLIFDTQTRSAADYGYWKQGMDPDVLDAFPAQRFIREHPAKKPRDFHVHHENEVQLKTNIGFWIALNRDFGVPWGPWGWGCGHTVEDVDRAEAERLGLIKPEDRPQPVEKDFNDRLEASVSNLDPDLKARLKDAFGDQVEIDGDTARWTGKSPAPEPKQYDPETVINKVQQEVPQLFKKLDKIKQSAPAEAGLSKLTEAEAAAIHYYTTDGYYLLNLNLRNRQKLSKEMEHVAAAIDSGLDQLPAHKGTVFRGLEPIQTIRQMVQDKWKPGSIVSDAGYVSASIKKSVSESFGSSINLIIRSRSGRTIAHISDYPTEGEVLFKRGTRFRVLRRDLTGSVWQIELEEV